MRDKKAQSVLYVLDRLAGFDLYLVILAGLWIVISNLSLTNFDVHLLLAASAPADKGRLVSRLSAGHHAL